MIYSKRPDTWATNIDRPRPLFIQIPYYTYLLLTLSYFLFLSHNYFSNYFFLLYLIFVFKCLDNCYILFLKRQISQRIIPYFCSILFSFVLNKSYIKMLNDQKIFKLIFRISCNITQHVQKNILEIKYITAIFLRTFSINIFIEHSFFHRTLKKIRALCFIYLKTVFFWYKMTNLFKTYVNVY